MLRPLIASFTALMASGLLAGTGCDKQQQALGPSDPGPVHIQDLSQFNVQTWSLMAGDGWSYLRRASSSDDDTVNDPTAPFVPPEALRIVFTPDMGRDSEPSVHWIALPHAREVLAVWWMKLSPNWTPSPAGGGKITFLWSTGGMGQVYSNIGGSSAPHRININTEWAPYGQRFWDPNKKTTPVLYDRWYRIEWYVKWESVPGAHDGILRWWVNGALNGDYVDVMFPAVDNGFEQFEFAPTLQNPPPAKQYMYIGHTSLSVK